MTVGAQQPAENRASLATVAREWARIGVTGFGGPPAHIALLRELMVDRKGWMDASSFSGRQRRVWVAAGPGVNAAGDLLRLPRRWTGRRNRRRTGFIVPAVALILVLSLLFLQHSPPLWVLGAGAGAGAAVAAVAVHAARGLVRPSFDRVRKSRLQRARDGSPISSPVLPPWS